MSSLGSQKNLAISETEEAPDRKSLELAFQTFSAVSSQLVDSYAHLQSHVSELQGELVASNKEKLRVAKDKENIANRLEHLLDLLPGGVVVIDSYGKVEQCNLVTVDFLGESLIGKSWASIIEEKFSPRIDDGHEVSLKDGRRLSISTRSMGGTAIGRTAKNGTAKNGNAKNGTAKDGTAKSGTAMNGRHQKQNELGNKKGQIVLLTDQTQTRELQDRLSRHDRLSTMGKMVAYLAHQIRTPLSSAMLYGGHLKTPDLAPEQRVDFGTKLLNQLKSVEQQISDLLIFAKGEQSARQDISIEALFCLLQREVESNASFDKVILNYENLVTGHTLNCNSAAFISAILNLINNACDAHQESRAKTPLKVTIRAELKNSALNLCVKDNGPGLSKEKMARVLEPFYSTKSKGTGLGLAVVQAVIKSLGGKLTLHSPMGHLGYDCGLQVKMEIPLDIKRN